MASKADMTPEEREAKEQEEFSTGPLRWAFVPGLPFLQLILTLAAVSEHLFRVLTDSVKNNTQVLINCRSAFLVLSKPTTLAKLFTGTTRSFWAEWKLSTDTATWCWRAWRRCGLSCPRLAKVGELDIASKVDSSLIHKARRRPSLSTRTGSSPRCSSEATLWSSFWRTLWPPPGPLSCFFYVIWLCYYRHHDFVMKAIRSVKERFWCLKPFFGF